jgi:hypothetical protein
VFVTEVVKIVLGERALVPTDAKAGDFIEEKLHGSWERVSLVQQHIIGKTEMEN